MKRARNSLEDDFIDDFEGDWNSRDFSAEDSYDSDAEGNISYHAETNSEEEAPDQTLIQHAPRILPDDINDVDDLLYIVGPQYTTAARPGGGGQLSTVTLGPGGVIPGNSDADRSVIPAIVAAEATYGPLKAGHLLNAEFGGAGADPDNLTILSTGANGRMRGFDNTIKAAVMGNLTTAYRCANRMGVDVQALGYGIAFTVTAGGGFWSNVVGHAGYPVVNQVTCHAVIVAEPTQAGIEALLTGRWGADRVHNHAALMQQLLTAVAALRAEVAAANNVGVVPNP